MQRNVLPIDLKEQRRVAERATGKPLVAYLLFVSTGMHPAPLLHPERFRLHWNDKAATWCRPKSRRRVMVHWSRAMKPHVRTLRDMKGKATMTVWSWVHKAGLAAGIPDLSALRLRHTHFVNRARLGHDAYAIANSTGTSMRTVHRFYTMGHTDGRRLGPEDLKFLRWLMEP
jgi:integrase